MGLYRGCWDIYQYSCPRCHVYSWSRVSELDFKMVCSRIPVSMVLQPAFQIIIQNGRPCSRKRREHHHHHHHHHHHQEFQRQEFMRGVAAAAEFQCPSWEGCGAAEESVRRAEQARTLLTSKPSTVQKCFCVFSAGAAIMEHAQAALANHFEHRFPGSG